MAHGTSSLTYGDPAAERCSRSAMAVCALRLLRKETLTETKKRDRPSPRAGSRSLRKTASPESGPAFRSRTPAGLAHFKNYFGQLVLTIFRVVTVMSPVSCSS